MKHEPNASELHAFRLLTSVLGADAGCVRLTATMLDKSIIDAGASLRYLLNRAEVVDFAEIAQGQGSAQRGPAILVDRHGIHDLQAKYYRPRTKSGDPRFWPSGLKSFVEPGELLLVAAASRCLLLIPVRPEVDSVLQHLAVLMSRFGGRADFSSVMARLRKKVFAIHSMGWVEAIGHGPRCVGETFEHHLGLRANSRRAPDFEERIEVKTKRSAGLNVSGSSSELVTLFAKTPAWTDDVRNHADLVHKFGYIDQNGRKALYTSVYTSRNALGWRLRIRPELEKIEVEYRGQPIVHFELATLEKCFSEKHPATIFVRADVRREGDREFFLYNEVWLRTGGSFFRYLELLESGEACMDFTAHLKEGGKSRDHGVLWRVRQDKLPFLFSGEERVL